MTPFTEQEELRALLDALCEERITPSEIARLEELVLTRPEAEAYYIQYIGMFAELSSTLSTSSALNERALRRRLFAKEPLPPASNNRRKRTWRQFGLAAGCLAITIVAGLLWFAPWRPAVWKPDRVVAIDVSDSELVDENGEPLDNTVAVIRAGSDAQWDPSGSALQVGSTLAPGRLRLKQGYAQIEFYSGATVVLEAPVDFEILSSMEAFCWQGKLRATVPPHAQGFTIGSPRLDLIDRGTEFGMRVVGSESTEVHVFDGKVELYKAGEARKAPPQQELTSGQAMRVADAAEAASQIKNEPQEFLTSLQLLERARAEVRRRQRAWEKMSDGRRNDPTVAVYYTFQPEDEWTRTLENQALAELPESDGTVVGCEWTDGRWPGKKALAFQQVSDRVRMNIPGEFEALTMAMWVRIDQLPNRFNSLLMSDSWDDFEGHWHIDSHGTVELGVQGLGRKNWVHYHAVNQFKPELLGQWVHLALVHDREGGLVSQYLNGTPISVLPMQLETAIRFGACELGNWNPTFRKHHHPVRFLTGRIDEFTLYSRALTATEIAELASEN
jgi:hypothetical protein